MGCFGDRVRNYKHQSYVKLKRRCQKKKRLFEDPEFPADDSSIYVSNPGLARGVVWKRPGEICANPQLQVHGVAQGDVKQGRLGNCWFVAACATLAQFESLWKAVIPDIDHQEWDPGKPNNYQGIFHFRFWRFDKWLDVVIDDRLPTVNGRLVFIKSDTENEFWSAMLEKAYAKLSGCYEALDGGNLTDALEDFTGGCGETIKLAEYRSSSEERDSLHSTLEKEIRRQSLMSCAISARSAEEREQRTALGLIKGHAYSVTHVKAVQLHTGLLAALRGLFSNGVRELNMIRVRNPWGTGEWTGAFSDNDPQWRKIPEKERNSMELINEDDGEFWMSFEDFCNNFDEIVICRLVNTSRLAGILQLRKVWTEAKYLGKWTLPHRAGGCVNHQETFLHNPQYFFRVEKDEDECLITLMQEDRRNIKEYSGGTGDYASIGFYLCRPDLNRKYRLHDVAPYERVDTKLTYINLRSVFARVNLPRGLYTLIPTTYRPGIESAFLLRIYTGENCHSKEVVKDGPSLGPFFTSRHYLVTRVTCIKAFGFQQQDSSGLADTFCVLKYRGRKVPTRVIRGSVEPEWREGAVFYRRSIMKPVVVHVMSYGLLGIKQFIGKVKVYIDADERRAAEYPLTERRRIKGTKNYKQTGGRIVIQTESSADVMTL